MSEEELFDALIGLFAYDTGSVSSGIYDEALKERCFAQLRAMEYWPARLFLSRKLRDAFLSEEALARRYSVEDVLEFTDWLKRNEYYL